MNRVVRRSMAAVVALGVALGIAALSEVPYGAADADEAVVRLAWRAPGAYVEECRRLSAEELERLPVHMRREEVCERRIAPYRLRVTLDGQPVLDELVRAAGAREDRPLFVSRELSVAPGEHRVEVSWVREGVEPGAATAGSAGVEAANGIPDRLTLETALQLAPGDVALITYDVDRHLLVARGRGVLR